MDLFKAAVVGSFLLTACGNEPQLPVPRLRIPTSEMVDSFGRLSDSSRAEVLSRVQEASLSQSGRFLTVVDLVPPYIRVLDRDDRSIWSFGSEGSGPGELRGVHAVDFEGDSLVLVLSAGRLERFSINGEWLGGERLANRRIRPMSFATGCGNRLFVYGVPVEHRQLDSVPWLHEVDGSSASVATPMLLIPGRAGGSVRFGALYGVDGTDEGIFVWHRQIQSGVDAGYWVPCEGSEPVLLDHTAGSAPIAEAFLVGGRQVSVLTLEDTLFAGAAVDSAGTAFRVSHTWRDDDDEMTLIRTMRPTGCSLLKVVGSWSLFDAEAGLLVLARQDPFPTVVLVNSKWIESKAVPRPCAV